ncbi:MAG: lipocalin family protein [Alistipes sp.]|nr:hypothetical protein [Rikenellaceae bacterium]MBQ7297239.1 lipocalin family protein [Alistipes sp.]
MKNWFYLMGMLLLAVLAGGCNSDDEYVEPQLDVTPHNLSGTWQLESWQNGKQLAEGAYVYVEFIRKDALFKIYQNTDSFQPRLATGRFSIEVEPELGAVVRGMYDYDGGGLNHGYIVKSLTANRLIWVAEDDAEAVSVYVRADIPQEVLDAVQ